MPPTGDCFRCHKPGHWARDCPLKTSAKPQAPSLVLPSDVDSPPIIIHCPDHGRVCKVFTSNTIKNPDRKFYKCPEAPICKFFKWCDQASTVKPQPISVNPTCPCGSGPCRRETRRDGPNANRPCFVCCIQKGFGACEFFKWEDDNFAANPSKTEEVAVSPCSTSIGFSDFGSADDDCSDANVKNSSHLGMVAVSENNSTSSNEFTLEKDKGKESIPVRSRLSNLVFASSDGRNQVYEDAVRLEMGDQALPSLAPKHVEPQVEALGFEDGYESDVVEAMSGLDISQDTSDELERQSTTSSETRASLMNLIEQFNLEKLHFETVSREHVDALTAFTSSYKQFESFPDRVRIQLLTVKKLYEAETSEFATLLLQVSSEMVKSQKKMMETARKVAKEVRVYNKQKDSAAL